MQAMAGFESQQLSTERRSAPCKPQEAMPGFESQQLSTERRSAPCKRCLGSNPSSLALRLASDVWVRIPAAYTERRSAPCKPQEAIPGFESQQLSTERSAACKQCLGSNPSSLALRGAGLLASRRKRCLGSNPSSLALRGAPLLASRRKRCLGSNPSSLLLRGAAQLLASDVWVRIPAA